MSQRPKQPETVSVPEVPLKVFMVTYVAELNVAINENNPIDAEKYAKQDKSQMATSMPKYIAKGPVSMIKSPHHRNQKEGMREIENLIYEEKQKLRRNYVASVISDIKNGKIDKTNIPPPPVQPIKNKEMGSAVLFILPTGLYKTAKSPDKLPEKWDIKIRLYRKGVIYIFGDVSTDGVLARRYLDLWLDYMREYHPGIRVTKEPQLRLVNHKAMLSSTLNLYIGDLEKKFQEIKNEADEARSKATGSQTDLYISDISCKSNYASMSITFILPNYRKKDDVFIDKPIRVNITSLCKVNILGCPEGNVICQLINDTIMRVLEDPKLYYYPNLPSVVTPVRRKKALKYVSRSVIKKELDDFIRSRDLISVGLT